jgi:hypothetical protein
VKLFFAAAILAVFAQGQSPHGIAGRIRIERIAGGGSRFRPAETVSWGGDQMHWHNDTAEAHDPGVVRSDGTFVPFFDEPVAAGATSGVFTPLPRLDASSNQVPFTIHYVCGLHRGEEGTIEIVPVP